MVDDKLPTHLYHALPTHTMMKDDNGRDVPDYCKMISTSKTYSAPLSLEETPLTLAVHLSARLGCEKEDLQPIFTFKIRGAYNMMAHMSESDKAKGVITCSAGVAMFGQALNIPATVVMPTSASSIKWRNVQRLGAKVILHGADFDEAKAECLRLATRDGLTFVSPYDDPYVIAGQGTVGMEICRQIPNFESLDGIFTAVGGGGLLAGLSTYVRRMAPPGLKLFGAETNDSDAMDRSLKNGTRVVLNVTGPFADGTATTAVGEETFRLCRAAVDGVVVVTNDEICAAIKDVFEETRSIPEPSGALALAGLKAHIIRNNLQNSKRRYVAVVSGGNMNFSRLRHVAERAEIGEMKEVLMCMRMPNKPGSFVKFHSLLGGRTVTELCYRFSCTSSYGHTITSFMLNSHPGQIPITLLAVDLSQDEFAKSHVRHMVGGRSEVIDERVSRFGFPERPMALGNFLNGLMRAVPITMFHYRSHGADVGRVLIGFQVPPLEAFKFDRYLEVGGYSFVEETKNKAYKMFLCS